MVRWLYSNVEVGILQVRAGLGGQVLGPILPQALPPLILPFCWGFWPAEDFGPVAGLESDLRAQSWSGLFLLEEVDLLCHLKAGWRFLA